MTPTESNNGTYNDWRLWCRLCAKDDPQGNIDVFFEDKHPNISNTKTTVGGIAESADMSLVAAIGKFFWVEIELDEDLPKTLCAECFRLVTSLVNFFERVTKVQQMFCTLYSSDLVATELHALRLKYGLLDEERENVITQNQLPKEHYFESKSYVNCLATTTNPINKTIKTEGILENLASKESDPDNEEYEDFDTENILSQEYYNDEEIDYSNCKIEIEEEEQTPLIFNAGTIQLLQKSLDEKETSLEPPEKRSRRRHKRKQSVRDKNEAIDEVDEDDDDVADENESYEESEKEKSVAVNLQLHLDETSYPCTDCPRKFKMSYHLRHHMNRVHAKAAQQGKLSCTQCSKVFSTIRQLESHSKVHLSSELRKIVCCPYCAKKLWCHKAMQRHIKSIHTNEHPFICEQCGVAVRRIGALKAHMLTHTNYAPFACEICKKGFKDTIRLKKHMETHNPNKYICAKCGLDLNSRATLNRHKLVHSDEMQHKCDYCGRAFKRAHTLKNHLILHTGLKPYSCDFCDRKFANGSNCRSHKKSLHPKELAALEAAGGGNTYTRNIPKLEALKAVTKAADNLLPVTSKQRS